MYPEPLSPQYEDPRGQTAPPTVMTPVPNISGDVPTVSPPADSSHTRPYLKRNGEVYGSGQTIPSPEGSVFGVDAMGEEEKKMHLRWNLTTIYSCIYAILLVVIGGIVYLNHQGQDNRYVSEVFSTCIALVGMVWLMFFHIDLFCYKRKVLRRMMGTEEQIDRLSTSTDFHLSATWAGNETPPYRFLTGRHSGSFYLKVGLAAFCFGHLIKEGLQLGQQVLNYSQPEMRAMGCGDLSSIVTHIVRPLYSFYQLFVVFKYSNIVINRCKEAACFALMHIMATCLCFWFGTIVEDALEDYHHRLAQMELDALNGTSGHSGGHSVCAHLTNETRCSCSSTAILSVNHVQAIPYLYPFTVEFNLLLAGVWFIVWSNIGKDDHRSNPHHFQHKVHRSDGVDEVRYQSNLFISADCHASNKGLFAGLFLLMGSVISVIVFFVAMSSEGYLSLGLNIHYIQEGTLTLLSLGAVLIAYRQLSKLDFNLHPVTFLDDLLLFMPLPFFFVQSVLTIMAEYEKRSAVRIVMSTLIPVQVILQTPFIIDALRRCSNSRVLRYQKPGREIVTFLIVVNLTMWIINTFEAKSVESHYGQNAHFGPFLWLFISHTTLPLMLFYRFHSSVCLADVWKSAYEKGE